MSSLTTKLLMIGRYTVFTFSSLTVILLIVALVRAANFITSLPGPFSNEIPSEFYYFLPLVIMVMSFGPILAAFAAVEKPFQSKNVRGLLTLIAYIIMFIFVIVFTSGLFAISAYVFSLINE